MLSNIQARIERTYFSRILSRTVAEGYTADISDETTYPNTTVGYQAYQNALAAIKVSKGFAVELLGSGNPGRRGEKNLARISLQTRSFLAGEIGYPCPRELVLDAANDKYDVYINDSRSHEYYIDCIVSAETQEQYRILWALVNHSISALDYLPFHDNPPGEDSMFLSELTGFIPQTDVDNGILEGGYSFRVPDIFWVDPIKTDESWGVIQNISVNHLISEELGINYNVTNS
jgi:hypothetical protein